MAKTPIKIWIYKPWAAWRKNIYADCLFDIDGRKYKDNKPEKEERPFKKKSHQVEVPFVKS